MRSISDTVDRLRRAGMAMPAFDTAAGAAQTLTPLEDFGANPGELRAFVHVPADLPAGSPLVVVLHGCTQNAAGYDQGSGWSTLADRHGFALLFAEQQRANNPNLCFNWFAAEDTRRDGGEAASIRGMIAAVVARNRIDPARVFVTGLSAGGAMASTMLATYPEVFAGGAIVAGLPHGVAHSMSEAFDRMRGHGFDAASLGGLVRDASDHAGPWPAVSVWHGTADRTVDVANAAMIVAQWRDVHGLGATPDVRGETYRAWRDAEGRTLIEERLVPGMGHGTPIATTGPEACGMPMAHMLDSGVSSTYRIAASWGIVPADAPAVADEPGQAAPAAAKGAFDPARMIDDALRAAGLIRP